MTYIKLCVLCVLIGLIHPVEVFGNFSVRQKGKSSYTINVLNKTDRTAFVYIDEELAFAVEAGKSKTGYHVKKVKKIYAVTFDKKIKWGPIDLTEQKTDFYWKLTEKSSANGSREGKTKEINR